MPHSYKYDVFISYNRADIEVVERLAEKLRSDGLKVWFDQWVIQSGDDLTSRINDGLDHSRVLIICISQNSSTSIWRRLETHTFMYRIHGQEKERVLILRLDDTMTYKDFEAFSVFDWRFSAQQKNYRKIFSFCRKKTSNNGLSDE